MEQVYLLPFIARTLRITRGLELKVHALVFQLWITEKELILECASREPLSLVRLDPLVGQEWPRTEHRRFPTEADIDCSAKKERQSPVKRPRKNCWSAYIAYGGTP